MKAGKFFGILFLAAVVFLAIRAGGSRKNEPEQVYTVSAVGFDAEAGGLWRATAEVPLTRENEAEKMDVKCFTAVGETPEKALTELTRGLGKRLIWSHCAVLILGDGLSPAQVSELLHFAAYGTVLPLAAQVISTPDAEKLLSGGSLSTPAAGYDLPGIIRERSRTESLKLRCRVYEIISDGGGEKMELPRFLTTGSEIPEPYRMIGFRTYVGYAAQKTAGTEE